ncbi:hypothetical protein NE237_001832 [Protea cynaroides]|uniref:Ubiquitin-like protease family profile domain-containing protein n=1 Tax=Protea cynaroides TaxID=273540 RepID=A0A9Q0KUQ7_9MAGN|nr:hypothetical protein NE237_001832 [Protea cynaroides]
MMQFTVGEEVEVFYVHYLKFGGHISGWTPATILEEAYGSEYEVETRTRPDIDRRKMRVRASEVRPQLPPEDQNDRIFEEGQVIEMRVFNDLWIPGKVWEVYYHGTVGTNNISYSVQAININWAERLTTYSVSRSEVRVRREWVDGEWVPPPHLPPLHLHHHHQQVDPSFFKSRDSSTGLSGHSSEHWRTAAFQRLGIGAKVEIFLDFMGGWKHATIEGFRRDQIKVRYSVWSFLTYCNHYVNQFYDVSLVRPRPPQIKDKKITFNLHQEVEVYQSKSRYYIYDDGWYVGEVLEIYDDVKSSTKIRYYTISHPKVGMINVCTGDVRVRQEWVNDKWIPYMEQRKMEEPQLVEAEVEVYSLYHRQWILGTISESIENQIEVNIRVRHYDEYEILLVDASKVRPRLLAEKDNNLIYKENEAVEVFSTNGHWIKGEITEIHATRTNLFYFVKTGDSVHAVSKSKVKTRREWREGKWSDSSSCVQHSSSRSSPELIREANASDKRMNSSLELVRGVDASDKRMRSTMTVVKQRKFEYAQFYIGAMIEVLIVHKGGWEPGTILEIQENKIEVKPSLALTEWFHNEEWVRPKLQLMEEESHRIFQLHDEVEILKMEAWYVGRILEVLRREDELIYFVSHPTSAYVCITNNNEIRIHKEWRDGEWIRPLSDSSTDHHQMLKETNIEEIEFNVGAEVEVYSLGTRGWSSATILQSYRNHIEVDVLINGKKWIMHVDASRIRPLRSEMENDQKFNRGDFIEVRSRESWQKGEIWDIHSWENDIIYTILQLSSGYLMTASKLTMRALWNWVDGKWILQSFGTSLRSVTSFKEKEKELPPNVLKVDEPHSDEFSTVEVGISNANVLVGASSSVKRKVTRIKEDITWRYCKRLPHPSKEEKYILQCNYCEQKFKGGGIHRMKQHLSQEKGDAAPCKKVPPNVLEEIQNDLKLVPTRKKFKQGNASKEIQGKHPSSTSIRSSTKFISKSEENNSVDAIQGEGREDTSPVVKEGNLKTGPTGISGLSGVDGQEKVVEKDTQENMSYKSITATSHVNDEKMAANMEDAIIDQRDPNEIYEVAIDGKEYEYQKDSGEEFTHKDKAIKTTMPMIESIDQASTFRYGPTTIVKQEIEVQENTHDSSSNMKTMDISIDESKSACEMQCQTTIQGKKIQTHMIPIHLKSIFDWIFYHHGDILRNCFITTETILYHFIVQMCETVEQIQATNYENISEIKIIEWQVVCLDHKSMNIDNKWLMRTVKALDNCLKKKQAVESETLKLENNVREKIENEIVKIDMHMGIENIDGDIFTKCLIASKDTRRLLLKQMREVVQLIRATNYENISKDIILEWHKVCFDHNIMKMDNEWLMRSLKELENCCHRKTEVKREAVELKYNVKEKIENEIRKMDLIPEPPSSSKRRKPDNEDANDKELVIGTFHATPEELECLQDPKRINNIVVNIFGQMLIIKQEDQVGRILCHYFPTYFGVKIARGCHLNDLEEYYAKNKLGYNLIHCELFFIPMCLDYHWFLYVINLKDQKLHILDSIRREENPDQHVTSEITKTCNTILTTLNEGRKFSIGSWNIDKPLLPSQTNRHDCGVFMLKFMEYWNGQGMIIEFTQDDIKTFRKTIKADLLQFSGRKLKGKF